jgi:glycosyltransferase involved in cell wall biosynthesis
MKPSSNQPPDSTSAIRVLFFDHTAALGGGEIALLNLVRQLNPQSVKSMVVLGADGPLVERLRPEVDVLVRPLPVGVGSNRKNTLGIATLFRAREILSGMLYALRLAKLIRTLKIDLIHTNSLKADIIGGIAGRISRRPVVWHVRDRIEVDYLPLPIVRIFRWLCRIIPTYVIANSSATLRSLHLGSNSGGTDSAVQLDARSAVIHDGTQIRNVANERGRDPDVFRVGLIGRISPWKGQHIFLQSAALVASQFPNVRFFIIGAALFDEEKYDAEIRLLPEKLGIAEIVEFTGFLSDIHEAIARIDVLVHASITGEPFGQVIIEGMAAGKPIVATRGGGVPEIVEDGKTGILVPMGDVQAMADAICELLNDPGWAREMGIRGRERVENHFTCELTAQKVESVYHTVLPRRTIKRCAIANDGADCKT